MKEIAMQALIIIGMTLGIFGLGFFLRKVIYSSEELNQEIKRDYHQGGRPLA